jgi:hypothetical protein
MTRPRPVLAVKFNKRAERMLVEFTNIGLKPPADAEFLKKWSGIFELKGDLNGLRETQRIVRSYWQGMKKGIEAFQIAVSLGLEQPSYAQEGEAIIKPPFAVDVDTGALLLAPHDLEQLVWLTLLQHSRRLGICENAKPDANTRSHPYFIKHRLEQKFCSDSCAAPSKREAKKRWWNLNRAKGKSV